MASNNSDRWTFVHVNDTHKGSPRSYRYRPSVNQRWEAIRKQIALSGADLLLHGGDFTRDGDTHVYEYGMARQDLDTLPFPTFAIPGNMDVGNKHTLVQGSRKTSDDVALNMNSDRLRLFATYFGSPNWTFMHRDVRFTGFYAALAGSGLPEEAQLWDLLDRLPDLPRGRHHVAMMHYWLYINEMDEPTWDLTKEDEYLPWYFSIDQPYRRRIFNQLKKAGVEILFCGHVHTGRPVEEVEGVRIYKTPAGGNTAQMTERWSEFEPRNGYHQCEVTPDGIDVKFIPGNDQSPDKDSYGPGGHPMLNARDYSIAREQPPLQPDPWLL